MEAAGVGSTWLAGMISRLYGELEAFTPTVRSCMCGCTCNAVRKACEGLSRLQARDGSVRRSTPSGTRTPKSLPCRSGWPWNPMARVRVSGGDERHGGGSWSGLDEVEGVLRGVRVRVRLVVVVFLFSFRRARYRCSPDFRLPFQQHQDETRGQTA